MSTARTHCLRRGRFGRITKKKLLARLSTVLEQVTRIKRGEAMLPIGTLVRIMDWNSDEYMASGMVTEQLTDGRLVVHKDSVRLGAFRPGSLVILTSQDIEEC